jgi:hypothetical protein
LATPSAGASDTSRILLTVIDYLLYIARKVSTGMLLAIHLCMTTR